MQSASRLKHGSSRSSIPPSDNQESQIEYSYPSTRGKAKKKHREVKRLAILAESYEAAGSGTPSIWKRQRRMPGSADEIQIPTPKTIETPGHLVDIQHRLQSITNEFDDNVQAATLSYRNSVAELATAQAEQDTLKEALFRSEERVNGLRRRVDQDLALFEQLRLTAADVASTFAIHAGQTLSSSSSAPEHLREGTSVVELSDSDDYDQLSQAAAVDTKLTGYDLDILCTGKWLNDNIINTYLENLTASKDDQCAVSTFFFKKLSESGTEGVSHWKTEVQSSSIIYVPVQVPGHWLLIVIRPQNRVIDVFDSLDNETRKAKCVDVVLDWVSCEFGTSDWKVSQIRSEQQHNSWDCGVFLLMNARAVAAGKIFVEDGNDYRGQLARELRGHKEESRDL